MRALCASMIAIVVASCGRLGFDDVVPGAWPLAHGFRKPITITPVAADDLVDYPLSIAPIDAEIATHALASGADLVFTASDGATPLAHEIVSMGSSAATLDAWVRLPTLSSRMPTTIFVYYGGPPGTPTPPWSPLFAGAWHLESCSRTADRIAGHDAIQGDPRLLPQLAGGIAGTGCMLDGLDDTLDAADPPDGSLDFGTRSFSFSVWVQTDASAAAYDIALTKGGSSSGVLGYDFELGTADWSAHINDGSGPYDVDAGTELEFLGRWVHLVAVVDRTAMMFSIYADGLLRASRSIAGVGSVDTDEQISFGRSSNSFLGVVDEPRVYNEALSPAWIAADHAYLTRRSELIVFGPEQSK